MKLRLITAATFIVLGLSQTMCLENSLTQYLQESTALKELSMELDLALLASAETGMDAYPELYLNAPNAYTTSFAPDYKQSLEVQLGLRHRLPYGIMADLSWLQNLYVDSDGFIHAFGGQISFTAPLSSGISWNILDERHGVSLERDYAVYARNRILMVRQFLLDWFYLYRKHKDTQYAIQKAEYAYNNVALQKQLVERGDVAPHALWIFEREAWKAERELVQIRQDFQEAQNSFFVSHGIVFPENPVLPDEDFSLEKFTLSTLRDTELELIELDQLHRKLSYQSTQQSSAPKVSVSFSLLGPAQNVPVDIDHSILAQFADRKSWQSSMSIALSLSTRDFQSAVIKNEKEDLQVQLADKQSKKKIETLEMEVAQINLLIEQLQFMCRQEASAFEKMKQYCADMQVQYSRGIIDEITFREVELSLKSMEVEIDTVKSEYIENRILIQLLN